MADIRTGQMIRMLLTLSPETKWDDTLFSYRVQGWVTEQDIVNAAAPLDRRTAARITHMFMKLVLHLADAENIEAAYQMRDLFDCRVCAGHIAQVVVLGIMDPVILGDLCIFDNYAPLSFSEAEDIRHRLGELMKTPDC